MKKKILILLLIAFISCKKDKGNHFKEEKIKKSIDTIFVDDLNDTIKPQTANLKNNYKLIIFPALDNTNEGVVNFRLINGKKDNTYLLATSLKAKDMSYYEGTDFQHYFALHANLGTHNHYFWLYEKETGKEVFTGIGRDFDLKNELILYEDEDDNYNVFIYDVNTKVKTLIDIPYNLMNKLECAKYNDTYKTIYIKRVTKEYYYLSFEDCPATFEFRVKKTK